MSEKLEFDEGKYIIKFPEEWIVLEREKAQLCTHVGVVEIKERKIKFPHFIFFFNKMIKEMNKQEKEHILNLCEQKCLEFRLIGETKNQNIGIFEILDCIEYSDNSVMVVKNNDAVF